MDTLETVAALSRLEEMPLQATGRKCRHGGWHGVVPVSGCRCEPQHLVHGIQGVHNTRSAIDLDEGLERLVRHRVQADVAFAQSMANGDLTRTLDVNNKDDIGQLAERSGHAASEISSLSSESVAVAEKPGACLPPLCQISKRPQSWCRRSPQERASKAAERNR